MVIYSSSANAISPKLCIYNYTGAISGSSDFSDERQNTRLFGVNCNETENFITECQNSTDDRECGTHSDAQVICQGMYINVVEWGLIMWFIFTLVKPIAESILMHWLTYCHSSTE